MSYQKVAFYTLGCKLNFSETSTLEREFMEQGYQKVAFQEKADVYVINTCTVTERADKKCRNAIRRAIKKSPDAFIAVIGCYAQIHASDIRDIPGVNMVLGNQEKYQLLEYLNDIDEDLQAQAVVKVNGIEKNQAMFPAYSMHERTRSFLKVQDGCNYFCAYCTIPYARGRSRNISVAELVKQAERIGKSGVKEIVLTGINIGDFGRTTDESFIELLRALDQAGHAERYRISSIEPDLLSGEIIDFVMQSEKFVPHFHIPLQSGCNKTLAAMKRRYKRELYKERLEMIKQKDPYASVGVDVIVGFPGETDDDFEDTYQFLKYMDFSYLHVFKYSERPGTLAASLQSKVEHPVKEERSRILHQLSEEKQRQFYQKNIGRHCSVLFESANHSGKIVGYTENYVRVEIPYDPVLAENIVPVELKEIDSAHAVKAEVLTEPEKKI